MGKVILATAADGLNFSTPAANAGFNAIGCCQSTFNDITEANQQVPFVRGGTLSNLSINVSRSFATCTYSSRIAGANGNLTVAAPNSTGLTQDLVHQDTVTAGQLVNFGCTASNFQNVSGASMQFDGGSNYGLPYCIGVGQAISIGNNATRYLPCFCGSQTVQPVATETDAQVQFPAITISNLFIVVVTNTFNAACVFTLRKNASTSLNNTISVGAGATGLIQDNIHQDTITSGDKLAVQESNTSSASGFTFRIMGMWGDVLPGAPVLLGGVLPGQTALPTNSTNYAAFVGDQISAATQTELLAQCAAAASLSWTQMHMRVGTPSSLSTTVTVTSRINAANGNQTLAIPPNTGGDFVDLVHQDTVTKSNLIDVQIATSGASGAGSYYYIVNFFTDLQTLATVPRPRPRIKNRTPKKFGYVRRYWPSKVSAAIVPPGPSGGVHQEIFWFGVRAIVVENTNQAGRMLGFTLNSTSADFSLIMAELASKEDAYVANNP